MDVFNCDLYRTWPAEVPSSGIPVAATAYGPATAAASAPASLILKFHLPTLPRYNRCRYLLYMLLYVLLKVSSKMWTLGAKTFKTLQTLWTLWTNFGLIESISFGILNSFLLYNSQQLGIHTVETSRNLIIIIIYSTSNKF